MFYEWKGTKLFFTGMVMVALFIACAGCLENAAVKPVRQTYGPVVLDIGTASKDYEFYLIPRWSPKFGQVAKREFCP